jgi:hypothetical protein
VRFQVLTASMMFRIVFWDVLPCKKLSTIILHGNTSQMTILNMSKEPLAVPWLRQLVASLRLWRPRFVPGSVHVGFMVDKVALGQVFLQVLLFPPVSIIPPGLHTRISSGG